MYRWVDHTAELELEVEAPTESEVLGEALQALAELLGESARAREGTATERRVVELEAGDRPALLAAWLEELVFLAESDGFVACEAEQIRLAERGLRAEVVGHLGKPRPLVKAVTYHRLAFEPGEAGYRARVVLDV